MDKLSINLENCYWIKKLEHEFDFTKGKSIAIYAPNGTMKTSFAKTFQRLQDRKKPEEKIFWNISNAEVKIDWIKINKENIFVIKSFESSYQSKGMIDLLVSERIKNYLQEVFNKKNEILNKLVELSWLKISKKSWDQKIFELEDQLLKDFWLSTNSFLELINWIDINIEEEEFIDYSDVIYNDIYSLEDKINSTIFQENIEDYLSQSISIYWEYNFLEKWKFTLPWLRNINSTLDKESFFIKNNKIVIDNIQVNKLELKEKLDEIELKLKTTEPFIKIDTILSTAWWVKLKHIIENKPEILEQLSITNFQKLRNNLWISYFKNNSTLFNELKELYSNVINDIETENIDDTPWKKALEIFNDRFSVPFDMDIENKESVIMWECLPKVIFTFYNDWNKNNKTPSNIKVIDREILEWNDTLSQWERRALYLLNIIFDIEARRSKWLFTLFIIDDIADSFDYRNKYAIIEYLKNIWEISNFYQIILTHNFDFYRTIQWRILDSSKWHNSFIAQNLSDKTNLVNWWSKNVDDPFNLWRKNIDTDIKCLLALIPFVRNLVDYSLWSKNNEYLLLTHLLHKKEADTTKLICKTEDITIWDISSIYNAIIWKDLNTYDSTKIIYLEFITQSELIINPVWTITDWICLEDKIILSITIRLKAEEFMFSKVTDKTPINWVQTWKLFDRFKTEFWNDIAQKENIYVLWQVNLMTPENIHLNSFMYEPILDMSDEHLKDLYIKVKAL